MSIINVRISFCTLWETHCCMLWYSIVTDIAYHWSFLSAFILVSYLISPRWLPVFYFAICTVHIYSQQSCSLFQLETSFPILQEKCIKVGTSNFHLDYHTTMQARSVCLSIAFRQKPAMGWNWKKYHGMWVVDGRQKRCFSAGWGLWMTLVMGWGWGFCGVWGKGAVFGRVSVMHAGTASSVS